MEDDSAVFQKVKASDPKETHLLGGSGRFWIAAICAFSLCSILVIATYKGTLIDAAGSVAILASIVSMYMGQNKPR